MSDINALINEAIRSTVNDALGKHILHLQQNHLSVAQALNERITRLERNFETLLDDRESLYKDRLTAIEQRMTQMEEAKHQFASHKDLKALDRAVDAFQHGARDNFHAHHVRMGVMEARLKSVVLSIPERIDENAGCTRGEYLEMERNLSLLERKVQNLADEFDQTENDFRQDVVQNIAAAVKDSDEDMLEAIADAVKAVFEKGMMTVTVDRI
jgi:t-SNARE complex subunit (syntaxin)